MQSILFGVNVIMYNSFLKTGVMTFQYQNKILDFYQHLENIFGTYDVHIVAVANS